MPKSTNALIDRFCDHLWLEDGLADLTLAAYRRDLKTFGAWLEKERKHGLAATVAGDIEAYLAWRFAHRAQPRHVVRFELGPRQDRHGDGNVVQPFLAPARGDDDLLEFRSWRSARGRGIGCCGDDAGIDAPNGQHPGQQSTQRCGVHRRRFPVRAGRRPLAYPVGPGPGRDRSRASCARLSAAIDSTQAA